MGIPSKVPFHRQPGFPILLVQIAITVLSAVAFFVMNGFVAGYSAFIGGMIATIGHAYLAYQTFRYFGARSAKSIVQAFWAGEMGKLILTTVLFALVFVGVKPLQPVALFAGYLLAIGVSASGLLLMRKNPKH